MIRPPSTHTHHFHRQYYHLQVRQGSGNLLPRSLRPGVHVPATAGATHPALLGRFIGRVFPRCLVQIMTHVNSVRELRLVPRNFGVFLQKRARKLGFPHGPAYFTRVRPLRARLGQVGPDLAHVPFHFYLYLSFLFKLKDCNNWNKSNKKHKI
jgi:hypothetical protein